jgi:hypothetical protein
LSGQVEVDLRGIWLLIAYAEVVSGKFKSFPQLLKVTRGEAGPDFHLLDVRFPDALAKQIKEANLKTLTKWLPTPEERKMLGENWSQLPPAGEKFLDEFLFDKIAYTLVTPEHYSVEFAKTNEALDKILANSVFAMSVVEDYRPREMEPNARISQLARRSTIYGVKSVDGSEIRGELRVGFIAMGAGMPIPYEFSGPFVMYRLATL